MEYPSLDKPFWTIGEAAAYLGLTDKSVRALVRKKMLVAYRVGEHKGRIRIRPGDVFAYLETCRTKPNPDVVAPVKKPRLTVVNQHDPEMEAKVKAYREKQARRSG